MGVLTWTVWVVVIIGGASAARPVDPVFLSSGDAVHDGISSSGYTKEAERDRVDSLPGWGSLAAEDFNLFSGYVTVDETAGRSLFYVFVENKNSQKDPLVMWLNGGPGCSSVGGGFMSELGPFFPVSRGGGEVQLIRNAHAWHRAASMLFLESPAFVGFSYSNRSEDAMVGDQRTAEDSHAFLLRWFERFPQFRSNPFWLSGESYAGHYIPNLAEEIVKGNQAAAQHSVRSSSAARGDAEAATQGHINFKGFLVGNAWTDTSVDNSGAVEFWWTHGMISFSVREGIDAHCDYSQVGPLVAGVGNALTDPAHDSPGAADFWWTHALISDDAFQGILAHCNFTSIDPLNGAEYVSAAPASAGRSGVMKEEGEEESRGAAQRSVLSTGERSEEQLCDDYVTKGFSQIAGINIYDIYADVCLPPAVAAPARQLGAMLADHPAGFSTRMLAKAKYDPCVDDAVTLYLNRPEVQHALHANTTHLPHPWATCTPYIQYSRSDLLSSMLPVYKRLLQSGIKILVYSGDVDAIVPVIGTRRWIHSLGLQVEKEWRAWRSDTRQVGGWVVDYQGLSLASVRGAGHMVPYTQPERGFHLFSTWIRGEEL